MQQQIEKLYNPLFFYIKKRINSKEDAEDLTQEVFYKLARSNRDGIENVKSWVYTIAKNTITDYYRKKKMIADEIQDDVLGEEQSHSDAIEDLSKCVDSFISSLPMEYSTIMKLSELEDVPQKEIAQRLNMNYVTVRSKIQRGRKKLKDLFYDCCTIIQGGKGSVLGYEPKSCKEGDDC